MPGERLGQGDRLEWPSASGSPPGPPCPSSGCVPGFVAPTALEGPVPAAMPWSLSKKLRCEQGSMEGTLVGMAWSQEQQMSKTLQVPPCCVPSSQNTPLPADSFFIPLYLMN